MASSRGQPKQVMIENVEYRGWKNNLRIANATTELIVTLDVGPRVICYRKPGGFNVMKNYDEHDGRHGRERMANSRRTAFLDRSGRSHAHLFRRQQPSCAHPAWRIRGTLHSAAGGTEYGIQKVMEIAPGRIRQPGSRALDRHQYRPRPDDTCPMGANCHGPRRHGDYPDCRRKANHPGHPSDAKHPGDFGPNLSLILWPYFDFTDDRWTFGSRYIFLRQNAKKGPTKIGLGHPVPWVAYLNRGTLFVKRFRHHEWAKYPDTGTSYQTFTNEDMLEMETVGVLCTLLPGQSAELEETGSCSRMCRK